MAAEQVHPVGMSTVVVGVYSDRPDGSVIATFSGDDRETWALQMRWKKAVQAGCSLIAAGDRASQLAGVSGDEFKQYIRETWQNARGAFLDFDKGGEEQ